VQKYEQSRCNNKGAMKELRRKEKKIGVMGRRTVSVTAASSVSHKQKPHPDQNDDKRPPSAPVNLEIVHFREQES
jgi:hypothetical protein